MANTFVQTSQPTVADGLKVGDFWLNPITYVLNICLTTDPKITLGQFEYRGVQGKTTVGNCTNSMVAGGTGATQGGWDSAANRDVAIATIGEIKSQVNAVINALNIANLVAVVAGNVVAGGTGAAAGCWDTAGNRDTSITTLGVLKTQLNALIAALVAGGTFASGQVAAVAGLIPAGGTGANAGGWDTSGNRDTTITTCTEIKTSLNKLLEFSRVAGLIS